MDPNSGKLYTEEQMSKLSAEEKDRLVLLEGRQADIERISHAVQAMNRAERRAAERADRKRGR